MLNNFQSEFVWARGSNWSFEEMAGQVRVSQSAVENDTHMPDARIRLVDELISLVALGYERCVMSGDPAHLATVASIVADAHREIAKIDTVGFFGSYAWRVPLALSALEFNTAVMLLEWQGDATQARAVLDRAETLLASATPGYDSRLPTSLADRLAALRVAIAGGA